MDVLSSHIMEEEMNYNLSDFLQRMRETPHGYEEEHYDEVTFKNYERFSNLEEHRDYYQQIKVCKAILNDIKNQSPFILRMEKYCPGVGGLTLEDILKIRYDPEGESYIIYTDGSQYDIYEGDIRFIYPSIVDIPDSSEYEVVIEDSSVYVYHRFTSDLPFRVFGLAEAEE